MSKLGDTLAERGSRYGSFEGHAEIAQELQFTIHQTKGWPGLRADQRQALTVICDKIARILNGDPDYIDNWHDIQGYAKLVEDRLKRDEERRLNGPELPLAVDPASPRYRGLARTHARLTTGEDDLAGDGRGNGLRP